MLRERSYCLDLHGSARSRWSDSKDSDGGAAVAVSTSRSWRNPSEDLGWTAQARMPIGCS
jgi:hypothetical protein